ncbi:MAG: hypothetical protein ABR600_12770 [Actinomycetota bacterium]
MRRGVFRPIVAVTGLAVAAAMVSVPAFSVEKPNRAGAGLLAHLSQSVQFRYYLAHPDEAPEGFAPRLGAVHPVSSRVSDARPVAPTGARFNLDTTGLSQNEESVTVCENRPSFVLSATNDYRGLLDPEGNFTGWAISTDRGRSVAKEGLMPSVNVGGVQTPSGGDPVVAADEHCTLYGASLAYSATDPSGPTPNGIVMYRSTPETLGAATCGDATSGFHQPSMSDPDCWSSAVAAQTVGGPAGHFLDKEWLAVGDTGDGEHVWVTYSDFTNADTTIGFSRAQVFAVRCDENLADCTAPILISETDNDVAFSYVTVGPDGRTYVTWAGVQGELEGRPQTFSPRMRIAPAGSTTFGPIRTVDTLENAIGFDTVLHADDFRVATGPKNAVQMVDGHARELLVYEECNYRIQGLICEEPRVTLAWSDDDGATWAHKRISVRGDNYFPTLAVDPDTGKPVAAWFTNRYDPFHHRQDIEMAVLDRRSLKVVVRKRVTRVSNEPNADYLLGGVFIGDYIQVAAVGGRAFIAYNANFVPMPFLGGGAPEYQQDNYLSVRKLT